ncbi:MAG: dTDP-4-dehydrorhamnose reductase [Candidatus Omnitrophica bacterium]|nr:dTDP-4-dehydrorhamnose reductase [Candidatus Omnitrophota bacterium]
MRIIIVGANGQLGSDLSLILSKYNPICLTHKHIEVSDVQSVKKIFKKYQPQILINTSAFHNVALCEKLPEEAFRINFIGVKNLAENALLYNTTLVHISTNYVFDGNKKRPYIEEDIPSPINTYGISKLAGEYVIRYMLKKYFIVRTSALFGTHLCRAKGTNFVETILKLHKENKKIKVVNDEFTSPTYSLDLAKQISVIIKTSYYGIFHASNHGFCSWYNFAQTIFEILGIKKKVIPVKAENFHPELKRPAFSALENRRLKELGLDQMRFWKDALREYLKNKGYL